MFKIKATDKWCREMAKIEADHDISAGGMISEEELSLVKAKAERAIVRQVRSSKEDILRAERRWVGYSRFMHMLRIQKRITIDQLAQEIDVDSEQLLFIESKLGYKAPPRTLRNLAKFYRLPMKGFLQLAGVLATDKRLEENMVKFAAESDSFETLSAEEKRLLNDLIKLISDRSSVNSKSLKET